MTNFVYLNSIIKEMLNYNQQNTRCIQYNEYIIFSYDYNILINEKKN